MPLPSIRLIAWGLALAALAGLFLVQEAALTRVKGERDFVKSQYAAAVSRAAVEAAEAERRYRELETTMATRIKEKDDAMLKEKRAGAARLAAAAAAVDGLRGPIAEFAAPAGEAGEAAAAACRGRAAALGGLLERALRLAARRTGDAEDHAADIRRLRTERAALTCGTG